ncbi:MAG: murein biosynthesis integral membrane protein MurJ [Verrucomicrobia bacterium GWF2_62_7]|nr:MAG: murein biosynthesis integral membrane protein MurJ [Verrucomicrobia bacterium GWF2_62_7]
MSEKLGRATAVISVMTVISRILGLVRDKGIAYVFGASWVTDAFFVAFRIPNMLRQLLAEGSLSAAFIPVFSEVEQKRSRAEAWLLGSAALNVLAITIVVICVLGIVFANPLVQLLTLQFGPETEQFLLTVALTRLLFPFLLFVGLAAVVMGMLNTLRHFAMPALAPALLNLAMIAATAVAAWFYPSSQRDKVFALAAGVLVGGVLQLALQIPPLLKLGYRYRAVLRHPALKRVFLLMIPGMFGLAVAEFDLVVAQMLAWHLGEGVVSAFFWAQRLMQLPLGIFGIAIATALLPTLAAQAVNLRMEEFKRSLAEGTRLMLVVQLPATAGMIVLAPAIIRVLLQGGAFSAADAEITTQALILLTLGICAFAGAKLLTQAFYALQDMVTPVKIGAASSLLCVALNLLLIVPLGYRALALSATLASLFNWLALFILLRRRLGQLRGREITRAAVKMLAATLAMTVLLALLLYAADPAAQRSWPAAALLLAAYIVLGGAAYLAAALALRVQEAHTLVARVRALAGPRH